jgi:hypothetical protein
MLSNPTFFIPTSKPGKDEELYEYFAQTCGRVVAPKDERIYRIWFTHDSERWTATVGEALRGIRVRVSGRGRSKVEHEISVNDSAIVMAIFADAPYIVFTDSGSTHGGPSKWVNPFMAGIPSNVEYFSVPPLS